MQNDFWQYIKSADKPIWLYGMGDGADKILKALPIKPYGVFASDQFVRGQNFRGYTVKKYDDAVKECKDIIVLVCFGSGLESVINNVRRIMAEQEVYAPDVPVYGEGLFNLEFARKHKKELSEVYGLLADEQSKKVFENTVLYKLTGRLQYLFECQSERTLSLLNLKDGDSFLDLGAYRGDTVEEFISFCPNYSKIIALEPDKKTFIKLSDFCKGINNVTPINALIHSDAGLIPFSMKGGRNSSVGEGEMQRAESIDSILGGEDISYIKMDVEGAEREAILGGRETILKCKPKMNISCYHRNEDLFSLPLLINQIRNDYKIYLRHNPCFPSWDTQFYFI